MNVPAIVFSRDRAMQLDALLRSLARHDTARLFDPVYVLWRASEEGYAFGYWTCCREHPDVIFLRESVFQQDVLALLEGRHYVCFFTDDDIVFGHIDADPAMSALMNPHVLGFSLRLGLNTNYCYPLGQSQWVPKMINCGEYVAWDWRSAPLDFGYPLSLDGHILRAATVRRLLVGCDFVNPNQLEDVLARRANQAQPHLLACFPHSVLVGVPVNRVNETHPNRFGGWRQQPQDELNRRYLAGQRIDLDALDTRAIIAAHQEIELVAA